MRKLLIILGVPIDDLDMPTALERLEQFIQDGRATGKTHQVATVNADFVVNALHDPELRRILQECDMATADGQPLVWGARLLGVPMGGRVTGADMVPALAERAAAQGYTIFMLGGREGVAARAAEILQERYPGLKVVGTVTPPHCSVVEMGRLYLDEIRAARPDILLVALGNPKQEKWINMHAHELQVPVCIGVGGTLDFIAGLTRRAPRWMQRTGLEWTYRLAQEPGRLWKRYALDMVYFSAFFARQWWDMRRGHSPAVALPASDTSLLIGDVAALRVRGRLDVGSLAGFLGAAEEALAATPFLLVDLSEASFLDSSALGQLVALAKRARDAGGALWLAAVPPTIAQTLRLLRLDRLFEIFPDADTALHAHRHGPPPPEPAPPVTGWSVVRVPRLLDAETTAALAERCAAELALNPRLILDFSATVFVSSAGLAALVRLNRQAAERGGQLRVAGCSREVLHGIRLTKLDTVLPLFQDVRAAAAA